MASWSGMILGTYHCIRKKNMRDDRQFLNIQTRAWTAPYRVLSWVAIALVLATPLCATSAEQGSLKSDAKRAGHALGTAAREIGQGARKVGKAVGNAAREGGREFRRAIKGESH